MISFTVPGKPIAKGRPRITARGGFARSYTPAKTVAYEGLVALAGETAMGGLAPLTGPLKLRVVATFPIAESWNKAKKAGALAGSIRHTGKPDADNILKAIGDGLNAVVWADDSQIVEATIVKQYGAFPGVLVEVAGW